MDAITIMNDALGGVTVNVVDDFSAIDPSIPMGKVTLKGQQAINFVRTRQNLGDQLNISRMERQKEYAMGFMDAFRSSVDSSETFALELFDQVSPYIVTDCSVTVFSDMMTRYSDYEIVEIVSPEGENVLGEKYYEFYVDEVKLDELILRLFYAPK
jgi:anionic cell wall polymer biosynthesis LytR-Cps2A-Psr (LCP) family protein